MFDVTQISQIAQNFIFLILDYSYRFAVSSKTKENKKKQEKTI